MISARRRAVAEQLEASDPHVSAFVEASAGSGKTKLLTDRILRLMLAGADPGRIQCLTFTKAAAATMALRLQERLGHWAVADDLTLHGELVGLLVPADPPMLARARMLFARVLDLPGGMRIGTIHAFCQSLLRRFPLEAAITPHFQLVEDADARVEMQDAREASLGDADRSAIAKVAGLANAGEFAALIEALDAKRDWLVPLVGRSPPELGRLVRRAAGAPDTTEAELVSGAVVWPERDRVAEALRLGAAHGTDGVRGHTSSMLDWLALPQLERAAAWQRWVCALLTNDGEPRKPERCFGGKGLSARFPEMLPTIQAEQSRVIAVEQSRRALAVAEATTSLLTLALPMLDAYAKRKQNRGLLDYGDLIGRTSKLLQDPGAGWVLYKLDGGLDHLLLDEVQDTAPEQWAIAHRLTEEFFAGLGTRTQDGAPARSFFAVGDPKQSIFSFQGAEPDEFQRSRAEMQARVQGSGRPWRPVTLDVSFRSTRPILDLVDSVFADDLARHGVVTGSSGLHHYADRADDAGRVELWPLAPAPEPPEVEPWTVPDRNHKQVSSQQLLADALAGWIRDELARCPAMPSKKGGPLEAADILVLVQRRGPFVHALVRALKARDVPVAGLDRLVLTEQAAVQDVLAACDAVLLPQDDLQVACVLTSPLGGLTDESLMDVALGRTSSLWNALRDRAGERPEWGEAWAFLSRLAARADHVTPHALIAEMLGPLGGRPRLLARLGPEAAEPLDELLGAALHYAALRPPSLQGFVHWLRRSGATVKREAGGSGNAVRVMTTHGAKGLQAPLVILADTSLLPPNEERFAWVSDPASKVCVPLWAPRRELCSDLVKHARLDQEAKQQQENNRLLYVAMTRAEDRLVICGWQQPKAKLSDQSWYSKVARGLAALGPSRHEFGLGWKGEILVHESAQQRAFGPAADAREGEPAPLPAWAGRPGDWRPAPAPAEPALPVPLAPSRPDDIRLGPVPGARSPLAKAGRSDRFRRGTLTHELLQHLPDVAPERWEQAARQYLQRHGLARKESDALAAEVLAVLRHPELAPLFGPHGRAEQPLTGLAGGTVITGKVDRMAVQPGVVLLADFKTGRDAPADVTQTPVLYLRQLAAYRAVLQAIYEGREMRCALIWTSGPTVSLIPPSLLDLHAPAA